MRPAERGAGRPLGGDRGTAGQTRDDIGILTEHADPGKQDADFGRCSCSAWARWRSAFRVAVSAIKGPQ